MIDKYYNGFTKQEIMDYAGAGKYPLLYTSLCCVCEKEIGWVGGYITIHDNVYVVHRVSCEDLLLFSPNLYRPI